MEKTNTRVLLFAPKRQNEAYLTQLESKVKEFIRGGGYILGREVDSFEKALGKELNWSHVVGCSSGTEALILALRALGIGHGDEVITPAYSFVASANVIPWVGANPVFADVDIETQCLTVESVAKWVTPKTRAIIAVDLYGRQAPIEALRKFCDKNHVYLIEDGAQSIGVPSHGNQGAHFFTTSFYPTKNLGAIGDGGAVFTQDAELAKRVREISRHGSLIRDHYTRVGTTARLDTLQAMVLEMKLPQLEHWTALRRTIAGWYEKALAPLEAKGKIWLPKAPERALEHVWALYVVRIPANRNAVMEQLRSLGVDCASYYPKSIHEQPSLKAYAKGALPVSERLASENLALPMYPELTPREFEQVSQSLWQTLEKTFT